METSQSQTPISLFLSEAKKEGKPAVFITSGGTSVPLEKNTVRSIDNFSTG